MRAPLAFADPAQLGDFLFGVFRIAREAAQRRPELLRAVDRLVLGWTADVFLEALPALRRAFSALSPREKDRAARLVLGETLVRAPDPAAAEALARLEAELGAVLSRFGLGRRAVSDIQRVRWRLILGEEADSACGGAGGAGRRGRRALRRAGRAGPALTFLYERETGEPAGERPAWAATAGSRVSAWINDVRELFPRRVIERLEHDALDRYGLLELVTDAEVLRQAQPSMTMLKAVLSTKHLMSAEVLDEARRIIRAVVDDLRERLAREIVSPFSGTLDRRRPSRTAWPRTSTPRRRSGATSRTSTRARDRSSSTSPGSPRAYAATSTAGR